jgi:protein gp37
MGVLGEEGGDAVEIMKDKMVGDKRRQRARTRGLAFFFRRFGWREQAIKS